MSKSTVLERNMETERRSGSDLDVSRRNAELNQGIRRTEVENEMRIPPNQEDVAVLAYALWEEGGRREGSADADWYRAEEILMSDSASPTKP